MGKAAPDRPCLRWQPIEPAIIHERGESGPKPRSGGACSGRRAAPVLPSVPRLGSRKERTGPGEPRHLPRSVRVCQAEHGRLLWGCEEQWGRSEGETLHASSKPQGRVGGGIGVCGRERRPHRDKDPGRRPLAFGKTGGKVPSERASCPRCIPWRLAQCDETLHGTLDQGAGPQVLSRMRSKLHVRFSTERLRKRAWCNAPCPYPTTSLPLPAAHEAWRSGVPRQTGTM
jgi:hypothetical protein